MNAERQLSVDAPARVGRSSNLFTRLIRQVGYGVLVLFFAIVLMAVLADVISPYDPRAGVLAARLTPPFTTTEYLLGTDPNGRDILSRLMHGARISLFVSFAAITVSLVVGTLLGLVSAYYGGWIDVVLMRLIDAQLALPSFLLAIVIMAALGAGLWNVVLALSVSGWVRFARVVRSSVLPLHDVDYVVAARTLGCKDRRIMLRHILPNVSTPVIVLITLGLASNILVESTLSFLGLGVDPQTPSWGSMLSGGRQYLTSAWWVAAFPGLAITLTVLCVNLIGDALRDQLDPRMMRR